MNLREEQKKATRQKIVEAVQALIHEKDYASITIREICQHADISIGSYYKYFKSKDDIIDQCAFASASYTRESIVPLLNKESGLENLAVYLNLQHDILSVQNISWLREVFRLYMYHQIDGILDKESINYQVILKIVRQGQADGSIRALIKDEDLAWIVLKMIISNYYCFCMQEGDFDLKQVMIDEIMMICRVE